MLWSVQKRHGHIIILALSVLCDSGLSALRFILNVCFRLQQHPQVWCRQAGSGDSHGGARLVQPREPGQTPWKVGVTGDLWGAAFWQRDEKLVVLVLPDPFRARKQARRAPRGSAATMSFELPQHLPLDILRYSRCHEAACSRCNMPAYIHMHVKRYDSAS